jgi:hypothetical protein
VALSDDFADDDPAGDEDPAVSAHAIPAPPNNAAPKPRAMAMPPTRPMYADARSVRLDLARPPPPWGLGNVSYSATVVRVSMLASPSGCANRSLCKWDSVDGPGIDACDVGHHRARRGVSRFVQFLTSQAIGWSRRANEVKRAGGLRPP